MAQWRGRTRDPAGGIGFHLDPATRLLLPFNERASRPRDAAGLIGPFSSVAPQAPKDGPGDGVFVPGSVQDFEQGLPVFVPAPTHLWLCQDDGTGQTVADVLGDRPLSELSSENISYQQSVAGWNRHFLATSEIAESRGWSSDAIFLDDGESLVVLMYVAYSLAATITALGEINGTSNRIILLDDGTLRTRHGATNSDGTEQHDGISIVRPYLWVRNAVDDFSGLFTDLEAITGVHDESAANGVFAFGSLNVRGVADARYGYGAMWRGPDADALISEGLANELFLDVLGFDPVYL